jgi:uncharacterized RDD family membrane protein YckC
LSIKLIYLLITSNCDKLVRVRNATLLYIRTMASRTSRFFAKLFDCAVLVAILIPSILLSGTSDKFFGDGLLFQISAVIFFLYLFFEDALGGQSIGKRVMRIAVVGSASRRPCNLFQSLIRNLSIVVFSVFDILMIAGNKKLRLGDRIAGTVVVVEENFYHW